MLARLLAAPLGAVVTLSSTAFAQEFTYLHGGEEVGLDLIEDGAGVWIGATVGDGGRIRFTRDEGRTWEDAFVDEDYREEFRSVFFLNEDDAWAVGFGGAVHRSFDSGENWTWLNEGAPILDLDSPPKPAELYDIWMTSSQFGWLIGADGVLLYTTNGGVDWGPHPDWATTGTAPVMSTGAAGDPPDPYDIEVIGSTVIVAADWRQMYRSVDNGSNWTTGSVSTCWTPSTPGPGNPYWEQWGITFNPTALSSGEYEGWMVGGASVNGGMLWHTTDTGATWTEVTEIFDLNADPGSCVLPTLYGIDFFPAWIDGTGSPRPAETVSVSYAEGRFRYEANSSASATSVRTPCQNDCAVDATHVGAYWDQYLPVPAAPTDFFRARVPLSSIKSGSGGKGWLSGRFGLLMFTEDSGSTWFSPEPIDPDSPPPTTTPVAGQIREHQIRLAAGDFDTFSTGVVIGQGNVIERTLDGGVTWAAVWPDTGVPDLDIGGIDIRLASGGEGVAVGQDDFLAYSTDYGASWTTTSLTIPTNSVATAVDVNTNIGATVYNAFLVGTEGLLARSNDAGATWSQVTLPAAMRFDAYRGVDFVVGMIGGGGIATGSVGYMVGDDGVAYHSIDGGSTWAAVGFRPVTDVPYLRDVATWGNGSEAVAVGLNGAVYHRNSTGNFVKVDVASLLGEPALNNIHFQSVDVVGNGDHWVIGGTRGIVLMYDGTTWTMPKSKTGETILDVPFQTAGAGHAIGQQFLISRWQ